VEARWRDLATNERRAQGQNKEKNERGEKTGRTGRSKPSIHKGRTEHQFIETRQALSLQQKGNPITIALHKASTEKQVKSSRQDVCDYGELERRGTERGRGDESSPLLTKLRSIFPGAKVQEKGQEGVHRKRTG